MAIYAVGDIQGCYGCLRTLLDKVRFDPGADRLWSVGDLVNRGPRSLDTLRFLISLGPAFTPVLGNHDLHLLALATGAWTDGDRKTLRPVLDAQDRDALCQWLRGLAMLHHEEVETESGRRRFLMVHAGLAPSWSFAQAVGLAGEVEAALRGPDYLIFLEKMYGNTPDTWSEELSGMARLRVITNYLTRMRFCRADGKLNFSVKTGAETAPEGYRPWYEFVTLNRKMDILFGHWASLDGVTRRAGVHALDTGCVWGRRLTLLRLEDGRRFQVDCG